MQHGRREDGSHDLPLRRWGGRIDWKIKKPKWAASPRTKGQRGPEFCLSLSLHIGEAATPRILGLCSCAWLAATALKILPFAIWFRSCLGQQILLDCKHKPLFLRTCDGLSRLLAAASIDSSICFILRRPPNLPYKQVSRARAWHCDYSAWAILRLTCHHADSSKTYCCCKEHPRVSCGPADPRTPCISIVGEWPGSDTQSPANNMLKPALVQRVVRTFRYLHNSSLCYISIVKRGKRLGSAWSHTTCISDGKHASRRTISPKSRFSNISSRSLCGKRLGESRLAQGQEQTPTLPIGCSTCRPSTKENKRGPKPNCQCLGVGHPACAHRLFWPGFLLDSTAGRQYRYRLDVWHVPTCERASTSHCSSADCGARAQAGSRNGEVEPCSACRALPRVARPKCGNNSCYDHA